MNAIQRKRAELERAKAVIDAQLLLLAELEGEAVAEPPAGKPAPRPKREPTGERTTAGGEERRRQLLALLAAHPDGLTNKELEHKAGYEGVAFYLKHPWFEKSDPGYRLSPWILSETGEVEAKKLATP